MKVPTHMNLICRSLGEQGAKEHLHWLPIGYLEGYQLYPEFFRTELSKGIKGIKHIISKE